MAGYVDNSNRNSNTVQNPVRQFIRKLSTLGMDYSDQVIRNIRSVPIGDLSQSVNTDAKSVGIEDANIQLLMANVSRAGQNNLIQGDTASYIELRNKYRTFALQDEIEEILDIITDEAIVFDDSRKFGNINTLALLSDNIKDDLKTVYESIYTYFGFNDANIVFNLFRKWLIDGILAFEIVYNDDQTKIIQFIELDPTILTPDINIETGERVWIVNAGDYANQRVLYDSQVIYLTYSRADSINRISYVARLIRSFNNLRIMESTKLIYAVTHCSYKTQYIIPVGSVSSPKGRQQLAQAMSNYKTLVDFNWEDSEIRTNGKPMLEFYKDIFMASEGGETPSVQQLGGDGPDLSNTEDLNYFKNKLRQASKIPFSRFDKEQGEGQFTLNADAIARDEIRFSKFIGRLRSMFAQLLIKPVILQMCINHKELATDSSFINGVYLQYCSDNEFESTRKLENTEKRFASISNILQSITIQDGDNEESYFDIDFAIAKFSGLTQEEIDENKKYKEKKKLQKEGYKDKDIDKIIDDGEDKSKFKPVKKKEDEEESGDNESSSEGDNKEEEKNPFQGL